MSFDPMAAIYDSTRTFDEASFNAVLDFITERYPPAVYRKLFEPGIGTGRVAIPLAERGYSVTGADISGEMLKLLGEKLARKNPLLPVTYIQQDIRTLPFPDATFDIAAAVHIFHLVPEWKKAMDEVFRVLKPDAPLVLMFTGSGREIDAVKNRYRDICAGYGYQVKHPGMNSKTDLPDYIASTGRRLENITDRWKWQWHIRIDRCLNDMKARNYSSTRRVPEGVHMKAMERLEKELKQQYGDLTAEVEVSIQITMILVLPA